jgi:cytoskeleton protein RodZ
MSGEIISQEEGAVDGVPELTETMEASGGNALSPDVSVGLTLRTARESKGLSLGDVARALKLSVHQVEALEADDWARLPCNTVIRGFVRNYARLLGLNPGELMAVLDGLQMPKNAELEMSPGTNVSVPQENSAHRRDYVRVVAGFAALVLAVSVYFFLPEHLLQSTLLILKSATQSSELPTSTAEAQKQDEAIAPPTAVVLKEESDSPVKSPLVTPDVQTTVPVTQVSPVVPGKSITSSTPVLQSATGSVLKLEFSQPSWVEIRDRSGEIIFSQLSQAGSQREVEGRPPFALVIGNATHVTLQYKGKAIDLSKRSKDDVARVTVE